MRRFGAVAAIAAIIGLGGCSEFNMVPPCSELGDEVVVALIPNAMVGSEGRIDKARVLSLAGMIRLSEVGHGYNQRTCRGILVYNPTSEQITTTFRVEQAEGAQHWQRVTFLDAGQPDFDRMVSAVRGAYAQRQP